MRITQKHHVSEVSMESTGISIGYPSGVFFHLILLFVLSIRILSNNFLVIRVTWKMLSGLPNALGKNWYEAASYLPRLSLWWENLVCKLTNVLEGYGSQYELITRRGKYTNSYICTSVQVRVLTYLLLWSNGNLPALVTLCEGNHYPFIEER